MSRQLEERQVRAVYESIDTGAYKTAVQQVGKLLKRQPGNVLYKALKVLALARSERADDEPEAHALLDEVILARPTDPSILGVASHALRALNRPFDSITLFEEAYKQVPHDEELGSQAFMANIRVGNWRPAQVLATRMHKQFASERSLWWAVMCAVLQGADPGKTDVRSLLLGLALRLIERAPESAHAVPDRFALHLDILQALERSQEALDMLASEHGRHLVRTSPVVQEIRRELVLRVGAWDQERALSADALAAGERSWEVVLAHINAHLYAVVPPPIESIPVIDPGLPGPLPPWPAPAVPEDKRAELLAAAHECRGVFERMVASDGEAGKRERTGWLALLELEKRVRAYDLGESKESVVDVPALLKSYIQTFGDKAVCAEDVLPHVAALPAPAVEALQTFAQETANELVAAGVESLTTEPELQRLITALTLARALAPAERTTEQELADARTYARAYFAALPLGKDLPKTEIQPADGLAVLAAQALVAAGEHLAAAALLETACGASRYGYGLRLCLVRVYRILGAGAPALAHYRLLGAKQVQTDTLSHFVLARGSMFSLAGAGELDYIAEATAAGHIYASNTSETPDMLVRAFQYEKYSQVTDFMTFQDRLDCSLQRDLTLLELVRMRLLHSPAAGVPETELADMKSFFDRSWLAVADRYDNRDFGVLPGGAGAPFDAQTTLGPCAPSGGWANAFLKTYLRAFVPPEELDRQQDPEVLRKLGVELPPLQPGAEQAPLSERVCALAPEELAELTEEERALLESVGELLGWVSRLRDKDAASGGAANGHEADAGVAERLATGFEDAQAHVEALARDEGAPAWRLLHATTLLHERFVLLGLITAPLTPKSKNAKKKNEPVRAVRARAREALKKACAALAERATREDAEALVERARGALGELVDVAPTMHALAKARRSAFEGLARGIVRVSLS